MVFPSENEGCNCSNCIKFFVLSCSCVIEAVHYLPKNKNQIYFFQIDFGFIKFTFWGSVGVKQDISQSFVCNYLCDWGLGLLLAQVQVWLHE